MATSGDRNLAVDKPRGRCDQIRTLNLRVAATSTARAAPRARTPPGRPTITVYYGHFADHGDCETPLPRCTAANRDSADDRLSSDHRPGCAVPEFL